MTYASGDTVTGTAMTGTAWQRLAALDAYRVLQIPRQPDEGSPTFSRAASGPDDGRAARSAVLTSAYHAAISGAAGAGTTAAAGTTAPAGTIAAGWVRTAPGSPVHVLVAGATLRGSTRPAARAAGLAAPEVSLALPAGGKGQLIAPGGLAAALNSLPCWTMIAGIADGLLAEDPGPRPPGRATLEECLLAAWDGPFGWLVLADPLHPPEIGRLAAQAADRQRLTAGLADRDADKAVEARRLALRHTELRQGLSAGLWRVHMLAGAADPEAAARVAALVCASADTSGLPYALTPSGCLTKLLPDLLATHSGDPAPARTDTTAAFPFDASTALLATLARVPETEVPGVRLVLRPEFDVTVEQPGGPEAAGPAVELGTVLDRNGRPAGRLSLPTASLNRHVFVCGATGAGKSQTVRALLESASGAGLPWLVIEPAKAEYRMMGVRLDGCPGGVVRIRPGEADQVAAGINPLAPAVDAAGRRFPLQTHADLVRALFLASFAADEPFPQVLSAAVTRVYAESGWDLALGEPATPGVEPRYPTLGDLQAAAERVVTEIGYGREITDNVRGFIRVRLSSLRLGTTGRFFEGGHPIDFGRLLARNVVFEIEDVGDDRDKAFLMGTVLIQ
ncbi:MAG: ATP-binding protein, partial [Streptosporangiales bacterium]